MAETPVELLPPEADGPRSRTAAGEGSPSAARASAHGWLDVVLDALAHLRAQLREHSGDLGVGAVAALSVAAAGWLFATILTLAVWATAAPANSPIAMPLHVAGQLWLAAHHVMLHTPD